MYSRTAQALKQMKLEVLKQSAEKMALQKRLDSSIELNDQMLAQLDENLVTMQEFQDERNKLIAQWEETQAEVLSLKSKYGEP
jgi:hypothetical protein